MSRTSNLSMIVCRLGGSSGALDVTVGRTGRGGLVGNLVGWFGRVAGYLVVSAFSELVWHGASVFREGEGDAGCGGVGEEVVRGAGGLLRRRGVRERDAGCGEEFACQGGGVADGGAVDAEQGADGGGGQAEVGA